MLACAALFEDRRSDADARLSTLLWDRRYHRAFEIIRRGITRMAATMTSSQGAHIRGMMASVRAILRRVVRDESGQDLIEYALVAALVGLGAVASMRGLSTKIGAAFGTIGTSLTSNV